MVATLGSRDDVAEVFHGACANQRFPMGFAGNRRERSGQQNDVDAGHHHGAKKLREAQVVTGGEADASEGRGRDDDVAAGFHDLGFLILLGSGADHGDVEEVNAIVARDLPAVLVIEKIGRANLVVVVTGKRHRAGANPHPVLARLTVQKLLNRAAARCLACRQHRGAVIADEGKAFRQHHQLGATPRSFGDESCRAFEIGGEHWPGRHLDGGKAMLSHF